MFTSTICGFIAFLWVLFLFVGVILKCFNVWNRHTGRALGILILVLCIGYLSLCFAPNAFAWRKGSSGQHTHAWYARRGLTPPTGKAPGRARRGKGAISRSKAGKAATTRKAANVANRQYAYCLAMSVYDSNKVETGHIRACVNDAGKLVANTTTMYSSVQTSSNAYTAGGQLHVSMTVAGAGYDRITVTTYNGSTLQATQGQAQMGNNETMYLASA